MINLYFQTQFVYTAKDLRKNHCSEKLAQHTCSWFRTKPILASSARTGFSKMFFTLYTVKTIIQTAWQNKERKINLVERGLEDSYTEIWIANTFLQINAQIKIHLQTGILHDYFPVF